MKQKILWIILWFSWSFLPAYAQTLESSSGFAYLGPFEKSDRILILAPHPDDESIGCAGIIQEARGKGANIHIVYLTNGDHNEFAFIVYQKRIVLTTGEFIRMGQLRQKEAIKAMELLGLNESNLVFLGYPDFGTFAMFKDFWQLNSSYMSLLTRISSVPYKIFLISRPINRKIY